MSESCKPVNSASDPTAVLRAGSADLRSRPLVVAHRGWSARAPENTLGAYRLAIEAGAELAECDVHLSKDGVPVLMHDGNLKRTTGVDAPVESLTVAELTQLDAGSWFGADWASERVPTLVDALRLVKGKLRFVIEIKGGGMAEAVVAALTEAAVSPDEVVVFSFDRSAVARVGELEPLIPTVWLIDEVPTTTEGRRTALRQALAARASGVGLSYKKADAEIVRMAHERGFLVFTWTVNDVAHMKAMIRLGVDAVITDHPDVLLGLVGR